MNVSKIKKDIIENLRPIDIHLLFSEVMFLKHKHVYICDVWVSDDPAAVLRVFPEHYENALNIFCQELIADQKITKLDQNYYWVSEIEEFL